MFAWIFLDCVFGGGCLGLFLLVSFVGRFVWFGGVGVLGLFVGRLVCCFGLLVD